MNNTNFSDILIEEYVTENNKKKKAKSKAYNSITYSTGFPEFDLAQFNKRQGTAVLPGTISTGGQGGTQADTINTSSSSGDGAGASGDGAGAGVGESLDTDVIANLVKDEEEAVSGYEKALDEDDITAAETKVLKHIEDEEKEHIKELNAIDNANIEAEEKKAELTEAKRYVRRYYIRPQNIFCSNKAEIIRALIDINHDNCTVYTLNNLGDEKDVTKLTNDDIIYYYDDEILYDKNHVKVLDYNLSIKHEEDRAKIDTDAVSDSTMKDVYYDRMTDVTGEDLTEEITDENQDDGRLITVADWINYFEKDPDKNYLIKITDGKKTINEDEADENVLALNVINDAENMWQDNMIILQVNSLASLDILDEAFSQTFTEAVNNKTCCICGEEITGYGNNAEPYKAGICCDACNLKFVIPARLEALTSEDDGE